MHCLFHSQCAVDELLLFLSGARDRQLFVPTEPAAAEKRQAFAVQLGIVDPDNAGAAICPAPSMHAIRPALHMHPRNAESICISYRDLLVPTYTFGRLDIYKRSHLRLCHSPSRHASPRVVAERPGSPSP
eukprot:6173681-Pleurochrysis_carterae.AAC.3